MSLSSRPARVALLVLTLASFSEHGARAQASDAAPSVTPDAGELKRQGDAAFDSWHYREALAAYSQAYELSHDPALLYNQGRALQALGAYAGALQKLQVFQGQAPAELRARVPRLAELIAELSAHTALLNVRGNVPGSRVLLNHVELGKLPLAPPPRVDAGNATLEVQADGYSTFQRAVELPAGGTLVLDVALIPTNRSARLVVLSPTPRAFVSVDGKPIGNTPTELVVEAGPHQVTLQAEGFDTSTVATIVDLGAKRDLTIALEPTTPFTSKWWFWTGVGVVVVGGIALSAALLTEKSADHGDFQP
ncbi:MAG TPA: PEGA domain-containing protein, partial [Polyangiaceae bacterium]